LPAWQAGVGIDGRSSAAWRCGKIRFSRFCRKASHSRGRAFAFLKGQWPMDIHKEVDARGLSCPLPILRAKKALADMQSGQILKVLATDPGSQRDFAAFAKQTGNEIVESSTQDKTFVFLMRRR
jgi:TusA-related sulfurtransferase